MLVASETPVISALIPAYNHESYVEEAIQSIWSQARAAVEIVVVDDASTDRTPELLESLRLRSPLPMRVVRNPTNAGTAKTLNRAIALARGDYVAMLASDDLWPPGRFESQLRLMTADPALEIVYGNGRVWSEGKVLGELHGQEVRQLLSRPASEVLEHLYTHVSRLFLQTALIRRTLLTTVGGFDESTVSDDWVLNIRIFEKLTRSGRFAFVDEDLFHYRVHDANVHKNLHRQSAAIIEVVERYAPPGLRREALARLYWEQGMRAIRAGESRLGLRYLFLSQVSARRIRPEFFRIAAGQKRALTRWLLSSQDRTDAEGD
jgi:alpha-1,3-rhamnosyltransferase